MSKFKRSTGVLLGSTLSLLGVTAIAADLPVSGGIVDYPIEGPKSKSPEAVRHYDNARAIVDQDPSMMGIFQSQCNAGKAKADYLDADRKFEENDPPKAEKIFDNLYFVPVPYVSSYAITTPDGIIMVDTLDNENEVKSVMIPALKKFGLDPANIKYAIVTHEHADHFGGAKYLQETYHTRIYATAKAWDAMAKLKDAKAPPPARDLVATDGTKLTLGGETVTMYLTPGHTVGTLSVLIPVTDHGTRHIVYDWGGTSVHNELLPAYLSSLQRFQSISLKDGADAVISEHQHVMTRPLGGFTSPTGGKSPLVIGTDGLKRYTDVHLECLKWNSARVANGDPD
jgi:metallo-beta-lactamase class B